MSAVDHTNHASQEASPEESKVLVGNFVFSCSENDLKTISEKIGDVLEAQVILRGSSALGYGHVRFQKAGEAAASGDIEGSARLLKGRERANSRGRGKGRNAKRGAGRTGGRVRRSADDPDALDENGAPAGSEEAAQNGQTSIKAVTDQVAKEAAAAGSASTPEAKLAAAARGGKAARGKGKAAKAPRAKRERGEVSKTLVYVRNIPFSYDEAAIEGLLKESSVSYASLSMPLHKFGPHKGQGKGFIFITASSEEEQKSIIDNLDGKELTVTVPPPAGAAEGEQAKERQLKLQARQGYENEPLEKETEGENGAEHEAAAAAPAEEASQA